MHIVLFDQWQINQYFNRITVSPNEYNKLQILKKNYKVRKKMTIMHCYNCKKEAEMEHLHRQVCNNCFCTFIEKRVKKAFSKHKLRHGTEIQIQGELATFLFKHTIPAIFKITKSAKIIFIQETANDFLVERFAEIFEKTIKKEKGIKFLQAITDHEATMYAKIKGISFTPKEKDEALTNFLKHIPDDQLLLTAVKNLI